MAGVIEFIAYVAHLPYLESVESHRCRNSQAFDIIVYGIIIIGCLEYIYPFEIVDSEHQYAQSRDYT